MPTKQALQNRGNRFQQWWAHWANQPRVCWWSQPKDAGVHCRCAAWSQTPSQSTAAHGLPPHRSSRGHRLCRAHGSTPIAHLCPTTTWPNDPNCRCQWCQSSHSFSPWQQPPHRQRFCIQTPHAWPAPWVRCRPTPRVSNLFCCQTACWASDWGSHQRCQTPPQRCNRRPVLAPRRRYQWCPKHRLCFPQSHFDPTAVTKVAQ